MVSSNLRKFSKLLTWVTQVLGLILIVYAILFTIKDLPGEDIPHSILSFFILVIASSYAYHIKVEFPFARISQAYSVNFLAVLVLGPLSGSLVSALGVTLGDGIFGRKRAYAVLVNAAVQFLTTFLTGYVYYSFGGIGAGFGVEEFLENPSARMALPLMIAAVVHTVVNISLLIPAVIAEGRLIPHTTLVKLAQWDLISTVFFTPLSFAIYLIFGKEGGWLLVAPLLFLLICWVLVQRTLDLNLAKSILDQTNDRLQKFTQIAKAVNAAGLNPEEILDIVLINGMMVCGSPAAVIRLFDTTPDQGDFCELIRPNEEKWKDFFSSEAFKNIVRHVRSTGKSLLIDEFRVDNLGPWFNPVLIEDYEMKSFLAFPILKENHVEGMLFFFGDHANMFSESHIQTLEYLAGEIAIAIRNARFHHTIMIQNERKDEELKLAERVQQHILPGNYYGPNLRIEGRITPARELSGDYFDIIELSNDKLAIAMGDVSGKGVPASLTMMAIVNSIRVLAHKVRKPDEMLRLVNDSLHESDTSMDDFFQYSTGFYAIINLRNLSMSYSIAGCEKPLWWHARQKILTPLEGEGLPLGMFEDTEYEVERRQLEAGDKIVFFTDGVTDAMNPSGVRFGRQPFEHAVEKHCLRDEGDIIDGLLRDIGNFQDGVPPVDDIGIMVIEVIAPGLGKADKSSRGKSDENDMMPDDPNLFNNAD